MKKIIFPALFFLLVSFGVTGCAKNYKNARVDINRATIGGAPQSIGVPDFDIKATGGARIGKSVTDMLVTALVKTKRFRVVERSALEKVMKEHQLQLSGAIDTSTAVKIGKLLGLKFIMLGSVSQYSPSGHTGGVPILFYKNWYHYTEVTLDARIVDVQTGTVVASGTGHGNWGKGWWKFGRHSVYDEEPGEGDIESGVVNNAVRNAVNSLMNDLLKEI
ncbi:hypothetical protein KA005_62835 [bacterium]|nr:hypothetical protein [bacterium]